MLNIREYLKHNQLLTDGAMGTYYIQAEGLEYCFSELANIEKPEVIERIHREYIEAGAKLIRTNTFAFSTGALGITEKEQEAVVRAACEIAERAAEGKAYIAGNIGPVRRFTNSGEQDVINEYKRVCDIFLEMDVDVISFETFSDLYDIKEVISYIRSRKDVFIMVNFCLNKNGFTQTGFSAARLLAQIETIEEIDACGFNCGIGSGHMNALIQTLKYPENKFISCLPNSGYPEQIQNRIMFTDNKEYFSDNMKQIADRGIHIIGGCCGTSPSYIKRIAEKTDLKRTAKIEVRENLAVKEPHERKKNEFYEKFASGKKVIAVELDPPYDSDYDRIIEYANVLKHQGVDIVTMADSPMGRSRADSILMSVKLASESGICVMPHICCRDKNMIAIRSSILGAYINGIRNLLLVTGDPVPSINRTTTTSVFDYNSIRLMHFVKEMNAQHFAEEPFYFGGALNVTLTRVDKVIERMKKKIDAGAKYFMTQPVYSTDAIERLKVIKENVDTKILCGIMPLVSYKNANFMKNEFIGIDVPERVVNRYSPEMTREEGENTGAQIARELIERLNPVTDGYYFMLPFNRVGLIEKIKSAYD